MSSKIKLLKKQNKSNGPSTPITGRDHRLDLLRFLAILMAIVAHALMSDPRLNSQNYLRYMMFMPDTAAIFFMASGAIVLTRPGHIGWRYVWRRIWTFLPEFIIFSTVYAFISRHYGLSNPHISIGQELFYMLITPTWAPGWFISAFIGIYLIVPIMKNWVQTATRRQIEIVIFLWLCATTLPAIAPHTAVDVPASIYGALFNYAGYMIIGYYLSKWPLERRSFVFKACFFAVTLGIGVIFGYFLGQSGAKWGYLRGLTSGLNITVVMVSLFIYGLILLIPQKYFTGRCGRFATWLSLLSLGIYCAHWLVIQYWAVPQHIDWLTATVVTLAFSIPVAWAMRRIRLWLT